MHRLAAVILLILAAESRTSDSDARSLRAGIANALVQAEKFGFGPKYLDEFPARIRAVTREQVNAATKKHFFADKLHVIVAGDLDKLPD